MKKQKQKWPPEHDAFCNACATQMGAVPPSDPRCITVSHGTCPYCKKENAILIPYRDFNWPEHKQKAWFD